MPDPTSSSRPPPAGPAVPAKRAAETRAERQAAALRANLLRRKAQARARAEAATAQPVKPTGTPD